MKKNRRRRHWLTFGILLLCEAFGLLLTTRRAGTAHTFQVWAFISAAAIVVAFLTSLLLGNIFDVIFPNGISRWKPLR